MASGRRKPADVGHISRLTPAARRRVFLMNVNPFEVLRLDPSATEEEVVRQAARLRQRAADEAELTAVRQAVQALTGPPEEWRLHALLTHPRPAHASPALDKFAAAFRRSPAGGPAPVVPGPDLA